MNHINKSHLLKENILQKPLFINNKYGDEKCKTSIQYFQNICDMWVGCPGILLTTQTRFV